MPLPSSSLPPFTEPPFVPKLILDLPQWICWRAVWDQAKGKWDKKPICVPTGTGQGFTKIEMGAAYDDAVAATKRLNLAGVGFVFHAHNNIVGIDLDRCRDPKTGEIEAWAKVILDLAETYAEVSPSGTGVHLFATGDLGGTSAIKNTPAQVEMYASGRYFTITGQHIAGTPREVNPAPLTLEALQARLLAFPVKPAAGAKTGNPAPAEGSAEAFSQHAYRQTFFGKVNDLAMQSMNTWVSELFPSASLEAGTGAWRVKSADLGRGLEEDISIHPDGIVDFGVHDMGDEKEGKRSPIDLVIEWLPGDFSGEPGETSPAEAALWLCQKLGVDPRSLGFRGLGAGDNYGDNPPGPEAEPDDEPAGPSLDLFDELDRLGGVHPKKEIILPGFERGFVSLVAGPTGAMKSLWTLQVALAIVAGQGAAGKMMNMGKIDYCGNVVLYPYEDAASQIGKRLDAMIRVHKLGDPKKFPYRIKLRTGQIFKWKNAEELRLNGAEVEVLEAVPELAMIVIDTLTAALLSDETNREFQQVMNLAKLLAAKTGAVVVIVHHYRKGTGKDDEASSMENIRGGSSLTGAARNVLLIEPPSKKEETDHGLDGSYMKRIHRKNSNGSLDVVRWFEREVADVDVVDRRDGARSTETAPALMPFTAAWSTVVPAKIKDALAKLVEAEKRLGRQVRVAHRNDGQNDIAQTALGMETRETRRVLAELERFGLIKIIETLDSQRHTITTIEISQLTKPELRNEDFAQLNPEDEGVENAEEIVTNI